MPDMSPPVDITLASKAFSTRGVKNLLASLRRMHLRRSLRSRQPTMSGFTVSNFRRPPLTGLLQLAASECFSLRSNALCYGTRLAISVPSPASATRLLARSLRRCRGASNVPVLTLARILDAGGHPATAAGTSGASPAPGAL